MDVRERSTELNKKRPGEDELTGPKYRTAAFRWFAFLAAFLILPNLPLPVASGPLNLLVRGRLSLDYVVVAVLALFLPRGVSAVLLLLAVLADFINSACATYLFSPSELLNSLRFGGMVSSLRAAAIVGTFSVIVAVCAIAAFSVPKASTGSQRRLAALALLGLLTVLAGVREATRYRHGSAAVEQSAIRIPSASLIRRQWVYHLFQRGDRLESMHAMPSATAIALNHLRDLPGDGRPNVVQILVESWGEPKEAALSDAIFAPYADPKLLAQYRVMKGAMPFEGPTTSGEARELCQTHVGFNASHGSESQMQHCLPMRMRGMGYRTLAAHGFEGKMFDREIWYPQMGFQEVWFRERFRIEGIPECPGPFGGSCDAAVLGWLGQRLSRSAEEPMFVHLVTLNSHLPVPVPAPLAHPVSCAPSPLARRDASICSWYQLISVVHDAVVQMSLERLNRPTIFVIVGDHAPPFDRQEERGEFSSTEVPYIILLPKRQAETVLAGD
jgi:Sulfatase